MEVNSFTLHTSIQDIGMRCTIVAVLYFTRALFIVVCLFALSANTFLYKHSHTHSVLI